ncbi:hypothetical protein GCM10011504_06370 [Siccirubricoccus deserti]|uniref:Uncharacterized protein n=1 Tax=Siccirubricoccus deserti TaxID=2013562 RepID=A0A9X0QUI5_9PROT|nr:hypothetical protein [Siccirubricoccus deserti]MBC4013956.1 hypothetical protein [Siccirubricoccus deserti]GGC30883.1 hypothetical protein GCM10011504_06370 [Siccirubricoccus deserti]
MGRLILMQNEVARRGWLIGLGVGLGMGFLQGAAAAEPSRRRRPRPRPKAAAPPPAQPPPEPSRIPDIDGPPPPSTRPGLEPAPVPSTNVLPPLRDTRPQSSLSLGVPTPPEPFQGQTFGGNDPSPDRRQPPGQGLRLPSPGATLRMPF